MFVAGWLAAGKEVLEPVEAALPRRPTLAQPVFCASDRGVVNAAAANPADFLTANQAAGFQDLEVLNNGGQAHPEWRGQLGDRRRPVAEPDQDRTAGRVGERVEDDVELPVAERLIHRIVKHILKYSPAPGEVKGFPCSNSRD